MNRGKLVFAQLMQHLPLTTFRRCVTRYRGAFKVKSFSCLDQFLCMAFAQLTFRESLRDIEVCLRAQATKLYHLGIRGHVARSNLSDANEKRDWRIYRDFANALIVEARRLYANDAFGVDLENTVRALPTRRWGRRTAQRTICPMRSPPMLQKRLARRRAMSDASVLPGIVGTSLDRGREIDALAKLPASEQKSLAEAAKRGENVSAITALSACDPDKPSQRKEPDRAPTLDPRA